MIRHPWQPEVARIERARLAQREQRAELLRYFYEQGWAGFDRAVVEFARDDPAVLKALGVLSLKAYARAARVARRR